METKRQLDVLDKHLAGKDFMCGDEYTIADMAIYPWILCLSRFYKADTFLGLADYTNVARWSASLLARPAVQRGLRVNGFGDDAVVERHSVADFDPKPPA
jgi:GSH-dependent disulfide-bond oxidoreductase